MNDLLNIGLVNDNLETIGEDWENIMMALHKEPEDHLLEDLYLPHIGGVDFLAE